MHDFNNELDKIFSFFSDKDFYKRLALAKETFVELAGPFDEDRFDIESKWMQFRDWYLYDFVFDDKTCIEILKTLSIDFIEPEIKESLVNARCGVFCFYKHSRGRVYLKDLINRDKLYVKDSEALLVLEKDDYVQTRVFEYQKEHYFGAHLTAHPPEARKYIDSKIKKIRKEKKIEKKLELKTEFLKSFLRKYFQIQRFKQVDIKKIYSDKSLFVRKREERL